MSPKSGTPVSLVAPVEPKEVAAAANAEPGSNLEPARQVPPVAEQTPEEASEKSWIEIELIDEESQPVPGAAYRVKLPDGKLARGFLDQEGLARIEGFEPGACEVCFPELDQDAWEKL